MRLRSCKTDTELAIWRDQGALRLTSNTGKELPGKVLNLRARKRHEAVPLQEIKDALPKQICDNAYMISEVERVPKVYAFVPVRLVVELECGKDSQLYSRSVSVFLHRSNDLDCAFGFLFLVVCLYNFTKGALAE